MTWVLESAKTRGGHCVIIYTDLDNPQLDQEGNPMLDEAGDPIVPTRTVTHDQNTGQNRTAWHANIRREIVADLSDLNKDDNLPTETDITDQVR